MPTPEPAAPRTDALHIRLAYGRSGLNLRLPAEWNVRVVEPLSRAGLADPLAALGAALQAPLGAPPLAALAGDGPVGIIVNDITRATPNPLLLRAILHELREIARDRITLFIALGSHRANTEPELRELLGEEVSGRYRVVQNNAFDPATQKCLGKTSRGNEVWINRELCACSLRILTGFIEPHFFAGFSGGGKAIMPGMAGQATVLGNHQYRFIADPQATWGVTRGNPLWEDAQEAARLVEERAGGRNFLLNITLNKRGEITGVFAGDMDEAHAQGVAFARETAMVEVDDLFEIVVTTNGGYPLDQNLYQTVKGISAAARVVRPGGAIVAAAECRDGIPEHGLYGSLLREAGSPQKLLEMLRQPGFLKQDQWQAQIQAQIQERARVFVHSGGLSEQQIREALFLPAVNLEGTLAGLVAEYGPQARICVLPEGPQTIPWVRGEHPRA